MTLIEKYLNDLLPQLEARGDLPENIDFLFQAIRGAVGRHMAKGWPEREAIRFVTEAIENFGLEKMIQHPVDGDTQHG
jgi:hypothetical protein